MLSKNPPGSEKMIQIGEEISIPERELRFTAGRSSGPGGQNVNKVSTRVTLSFDLLGSSALSEEMKMRIRERLPTRVNKKGVLRVVCQRHRSQAENRKGALARFIELIENALEEQESRIKTTIPAFVKQRRREEKLRRSRIKRLRSSKVSMDE
jgi:ribosome-associated protein